VKDPGIEVSRSRQNIGCNLFELSPGMQYHLGQEQMQEQIWKKG